MTNIKQKEIKEKIENWEKEFDKKWYLWNYSKKLDTYNTCGGPVKFFIRQLLSQTIDQVREEGYKKAIQDLKDMSGEPLDDRIAKLYKNLEALKNQLK